MIVVVCPGQGSQTPGFLAPWLEVPENAALIAEYSEAAGLDLAVHGTSSDADTIRDTAVAQPLIVAAGLVAFNSLVATAGRERIGGIAGHSVGEITAAAAAGILSTADAMQFVSERAVAMAQAAAATPTSMSAVLGGDATDVVSKAESLGLQAANYNGGGQIVVAGAADALARLADEPPAGARVIPLQVAGAFHTRYMESARTWLAGAVDGYATSDPTLPIWTNNDGSRVDSGARYLDLLVTQVASPVRWDLTMQSLADAGVTGIIELAPAGALIGLARRGLKGIPSVGIKTPDDLDAAVALIEQNA
ncbi:MULTISPECIES: ACP S-malonyltransferase [unclassified Leifsonia]|uniref:ACP S-malonyltransferase n=1 Tax=unclassified Leifsonia TaxID=2663824 RepID=UPI0006FF9518|nr:MULTISPECIES: ACP S-malonyltransferase [unclassified Leifsonia]KQX07053.1 ACP S-malonyltransferase [Leifsonia sp. Root1293]KRA11336.1 ACP S-malonyltransferase [Leifsonia sp. Root60]